jgi:hypothetical protein
MHPAVWVCCLACSVPCKVLSDWQQVGRAVQVAEAPACLRTHVFVGSQFDSIQHPVVVCTDCEWGLINSGAILRHAPLAKTTAYGCGHVCHWLVKSCLQ